VSENDGALRPFQIKYFFRERGSSNHQVCRSSLFYRIKEKGEPG
jgi:hypothetical protein